MTIGNVQHHEYTFTWDEMDIPTWTDIVQTGGSCGRTAYLNMAWVLGWATNVPGVTTAQELNDYVDTYLDIDAGEDGDPSIDDYTMMEWLCFGDAFISSHYGDLIDVPGGGGFYPYPTYNYTYIVNSFKRFGVQITPPIFTDPLKFSEYWLTQEYLSTIVVCTYPYDNPTAHGLSLWGWRKTNGVFDQIFISDSANLDGGNGLRVYNITWNAEIGKWQIESGIQWFGDKYLYGGNAIRGVVTL